VDIEVSVTFRQLGDGRAENPTSRFRNGCWPRGIEAVFRSFRSTAALHNGQSNGPTPFRVAASVASLRARNVSGGCPFCPTRCVSRAVMLSRGCLAGPAKSRIPDEPAYLDSTSRVIRTSSRAATEPVPLPRQCDRLPAYATLCIAAMIHRPHTDA
jgi:hypothetical protein